ncbi:hypothetical protein FWK35_00029162, partial [Aphis craccivora]
MRNAIVALTTQVAALAT